jgi:hypothetical protein
MRRTLFLLAALGLAACDGQISDTFEQSVVVESYQQVGEPIAPVDLYFNASVGDTFDRTAQAVTDAAVRIVLLSEAGDAEAVYELAHDGRAPGTYRPTSAPRVLPLRRYRLEADIPGREPVRAETLTPSLFELKDTSTTEAIWGQPEITFSVTRPFYPTRQAVFVFTTETLRDSLTPELATPFYRAIFGDEDSDSDFDPEDVRLGSSPLINEENYSVDAEGAIRINLPWIAVPFYGPSRVSASTVDDNLYDFLRSQTVQQGGSTLSPGEIPNVLDRVEGGVGFFGSFSRVTTEVFVRCAPANNFGFSCPSDARADG